LEFRRQKAADRAAANAAAALEAAIPVAQRERNNLDMHYFPLPSERGSHAVMPWFRESSKSAQLQIFDWTIDWWSNCSDTGKRKCVFLLALLTSMIIAKVVINMTPHE